MLRPDYPIQTARLALRPFAPDDLDDLFAYQSREDVARYLYWEPRDRDQARAELARKVVRDVLLEDRSSVVLAVVLGRTGRVIGEVNLHWASRVNRQGEFGFVVNPDHQGRGYGTEAAVAVLGLGFDGLGLHRIIGRCDPRNRGSYRLMERLGMRREAHFRHTEIFKGEWGDELVYAMLEDEWRQRSA